MADLKRRGTYTLTIGGKEVNLLFNMRFWGLLDEAGYKLEDLDKHLDHTKGFMKVLKTVAVLVDCAGQSYAKTHKTEWEYTLDDVYDWFEEDINEKIMEEIMNAMVQSKIMGNSLNTELGKKKGKK